MNGKNLRKVFVLSVLFFGLMGTVNPVKALGNPQIVSINPGSPAPVGTVVSIRATVQWDSDFRSMRICFRDENWCQEDGTPDITKNFDTSGLSAGTYTIIAEVAAVDKGWDSANKTYGSYELTGGQPPQEPTPEQPQGPSRGPSISILEFSPSGGANVGDQVDIHIRVDSSNPGATKINVSCGSISKVETSEVDFHSTWFTAGCPGGQARVDVYSRAVDDPNWANPSSASKGYNLTAPPSYNAPSADLWVDSGNIQLGQCTTLHWTTSDADDVYIDGNRVETSGNRKICPNVTTRYTLTATGPGGTVDRNVTVVVTNKPKQPSVADSFNTGDVINIAGNIYVIVNGERRHVPNPETLDALGITRSMINNRGFSDEQLKTIPQGPDIPDVNRDPSGFQEFKNWIFPNLNPIVPESTPIPKKESTPEKAEGEQSTPILSPTPTPDPTPTQSEDPFWCDWFIVGDLFCDVPSAGAADVTCDPQCVKTAKQNRDDLASWSGNTADQILADAGKMPTFKHGGQDMQVRVRAPGESPQVGDLIIWPSKCGGAWSGGGHVGYVTGINPLRVTDSNWGPPISETKCAHRENAQIGQLSCMRFITSPFPVGSSKPPITPDKCDQYKNNILRWGWCKILGSSR